MQKGNNKISTRQAENKGVTATATLGFYSCRAKMLKPIQQVITGEPAPQQASRASGVVGWYDK